MAEAKGKVTVTKYIPIIDLYSRDAEAYDMALFSAMYDLLDKLGYELTMRTDTSISKSEAWIEVSARKKVPNG